MPTIRLKKLANELSDQVRSFGFEMIGIQGPEITFSSNRNGFRYDFTLCYLKNVKKITIPVSLRSDEMEAVIREHGYLPKEYPYHFIATLVETLVNTKNTNWFTRSQGEPIKTDGKDEAMLVHEFMDCYFHKGVLKLIEETDNVEKLDLLVNGTVLKEGKCVRMSPFIFGLQTQILTGITSAYMTKRKDMDELIKIYKNAIKEEKINHKDEVQIVCNIIDSIF